MDAQPKLRLSRPTNHLEAVLSFYVDGLGFEVLDRFDNQQGKNGLMIVHFVGEENSPFYKSEAFMTLLQRVTKHPDRFVLKQHNNSLAMTVRNVKDVEDAYKTLQQL